VLAANKADLLPHHIPRARLEVRQRCQNPAQLVRSGDGAAHPSLKGPLVAWPRRAGQDSSCNVPCLLAGATKHLPSRSLGLMQNKREALPPWDIGISSSY
jgi:hypothetical protein